MPQLIIVLVALFGGFWLIRYLAHAPPAQIRTLAEKLAGITLVVASGFLALRGGISVAVPVFVAGVGLLGKHIVFPNGFSWKQKKPGQKSRVTTNLLAMELDHDTGDIRGEVLSGPLRGRTLSSLSGNELQALHDLCSKATDQSRALLESWLDRVQPDWRQRWTGTGGSRPKPASAMSEEESLEILGLKRGARPDDIRSAHRRLMKQFHPDHGGTDYFAAKINQAKDILLHAQSKRKDRAK